MRGIALGLRAGFVVGSAGLGLLALGAPNAVAQDAGGGLVGAAGADVFATYKGDLQRTGVSSARLQLPLNLVWRHSTDNGPRRVTTPPLVLGPAGQRHVFYAASKVVYCLDGQTGAELWHCKPLAGSVTAPLAMLNGEAGVSILALTINGQLTALNPADGEVVWQVASRNQVSGAAPVVVKTAKGDRIIIASSAGRLIAYAPDGALDADWEVKLGRNGSQPNSTPSVTPDGKTMFLTTQDQRVYVIDLTKPAVAFTIPLATTSYTTPVVAGDQVIITAGSIIGSYDQTNAVPLWRLNLGNNANVAATPSVRVDAHGEGAVYVGAENGNFYSIGAREGHVTWKQNLEGTVSGSPAVLPDMIIVGTRSGMRGASGELFALAPQDGKILWRYRLQSDVVARDIAESTDPFETLVAGPSPGGFAGGPGGSSGDSSGGYPGGSSGGYPGGGRRFGRGGSSGGYPGGSAGGYPGGGSSGGYPGGGSGRRRGRGGGSSGSSSGYPGGSGGGYPGGGSSSGYPGGGEGGPEAPPSPYVTLTYGINSPPAVVDGQVFVLADHGALYDFDAVQFDPTPPRAVTPSLTVKTQEDELRPFLLDSKFPPVPGRAPLYFAALIDDEGSGVDPESVQATFDGQPLPKDNVNYVAPQGIIKLTLLATPLRGAPASLEDGPHTIAITARDYRGNAMNYNGSFVVDRKASAPSYVPPDTGGDNGGGGGYPGGSSGDSSSGYPGGGRRGGRGGGGGGYPGGSSGGYPGGSSGDSSGYSGGGGGGRRGGYGRGRGSGD